MELFTELEISGYQEKVLNYVRANPNVTNHDLLDFGFENNFLPKHTNAVLKELKKTYTIKIISLDGGPARSTYIDDEKRVVNIQIE